MISAAEAFARIELLHALPAGERADLERIGGISNAPNGKYLVRAGSAPAQVSILVEGGARVCQANAQGKEETIALLGPGAHIGVVSLLTGSKRATDVIATCRCTLLSFEAKAFSTHLKKHSTLSHRLLESLAARLNETSRHMAENALYSLDQRLALRLLELSEVVELGGEERLLVRQRPSHQELANMLGASREAVTRALRSLEGQGHISVADDQVFVISTPL